jgi:hypothetical protein
MHLNPLKNLEEWRKKQFLSQRKNPPCPYCEGKVTVHYKTMLIGATVLCAIFVITFPLVPFLFIGYLVTDKNKYQCRTCKRTFLVEHSTARR